jgi:hypothetical protein
MSVAHVLGVQPGSNEILAVPIRDEPDPPAGVTRQYPRMAPIANVRRDPQHDLAVADVPDVTHFEHVQFASTDQLFGVPSILTYDLRKSDRADRRQW